MAWTVEFVPSAARDLDKLDLKARHRILSFLYERVAWQEDPRRLGAKLKDPASAPLWRDRIGRYRIISEIDNEARNVFIVRGTPRREAYR